MEAELNILAVRNFQILFSIYPQWDSSDTEVKTSPPPTPTPTVEPQSYRIVFLCVALHVQPIAKASETS